MFENLNYPINQSIKRASDIYFGTRYPSSSELSRPHAAAFVPQEKICPPSLSAKEWSDPTAAWTILWCCSASILPIKNNGQHGPINQSINLSHSPKDKNPKKFHRPGFRKLPVYTPRPNSSLLPQEYTLPSAITNSVWHRPVITCKTFPAGNITGWGSPNSSTSELPSPNWPSWLFPQAKSAVSGGGSSILWSIFSTIEVSEIRLMWRTFGNRDVENQTTAQITMTCTSDTFDSSRWYYSVNTPQRTKTSRVRKKKVIKWFFFKIKKIICHAGTADADEEFWLFFCLCLCFLLSSINTMLGEGVACQTEPIRNETIFTNLWLVDWLLLLGIRTSSTCVGN